MSTDTSDLSPEKKASLVEMAWLLNDLTSDLKTPVDLVFQFKPAMVDNKQNHMAISRLCITSLIVNLCKLKEIIDHYGSEIRSFPEELRKSLYGVKSEIEKKNMYAFRSKYVAHAFSKEKGLQKKPLTFHENVRALMEVIDYGLNPVTENIFKFCQWIYVEGDFNSVVYIIYSCVKHIETTVGGLGKRR
ncbi:integron-associated HEPN domain-containing protein [Vreelandella neptunia]|uniref:Integron-associated HEPN domain-containing protein n=1 Tax=Vreelandella neptunia TaxID=115551 RepID=A0ABZ0YPY9_9GAMM|nr:integron-associated HEPN domain-containing protein [Halomonas neptunia]MDN3559256.1 integron-associated HEPN domain-containing protein [Halomonas neptunia]WQH14215.1 integron-associated HEPN domain-containing protein [Halomonas neptunia]